MRTKLSSLAICFYAAALSAGLPLCSATQTAAITGHPEVVDGDGLTFGPVAVRLHGVDAPEADQQCATSTGGTWDCGSAAADRLAELTANTTVECEPLDRDRHGRLVSRCTAGGIDLAAALVEEGLAWAYLEYSDDYAGQEATARAAAVGVWQAETQAPWDYRANRWERAAEASPTPGCPIKGNISAKGERIYHTPWSPWYERTQISEANGERWFCDEAEAVEAGWRAAQSR